MSPLPTSANPKSTLPSQVHFSHLKSIRAHSIYPELNQANFAHPKFTLSPLSSSRVHPKPTLFTQSLPKAHSIYPDSTPSPLSSPQVHPKPIHPNPSPP